MPPYDWRLPSLPEVTSGSSVSARRRPGPLPAGADARDWLLDAAERLFAERGIDGASLRSISAAAGLTSAALHYHFASRDELVIAVLQRRRSGLLGSDGYAALHDLDVVVVADVVAATVEPWFALLQLEPAQGAFHIRLFSQLLAARDPRVQAVSVGTTERFRQLIGRLPGPASSPRRWEIAIDSLMHGLASIASLHLPPEELRRQFDELQAFVVSGISG
jgi:AcrR family transcriptional regulator